MTDQVPLCYEPGQHTYFTATLKPGVSLEALRAALASGAPEMDLSLLGSIGPGDMSNEVVFELAGVPSSESHEVTQKALEYLVAVKELDNVETMQFKQRKKR